ncbi:hypothetical protein [Photobacterium damselae]|uniref:Surface protein Lk90-like protein n=2 Tax=Photobacterium damselae TaxID=38293 RepID=D0Z3U1_PHODD|nr:hypothetical protein [Photobacterium damselae]EEZ40072.1 surface protein Lk90-like protein [Photobacterium damselae subsp. damselae CIP 102761]PSW84629.1 hypothetical protein CTN07_12655 [Photobacterium damselae]SPY44235.1 Uncharacterised protein [Photobacterium damselae]
MNKINIIAVACIISSLLSGCDGDNDNSSVVKSADKPIITDIFDKIEYNNDEIYHIDLSHSVVDPAGFPLYLESINSSSEDCSIISFDKDSLSLELTTNGKTACNLDYTVRNIPISSDIQSSSGNGNQYLLISDSNDDIDLLAISLTTTINTDPIEIDLKKELADRYPDGFVILSASNNGEGHIDDIDKESSIITFSSSIVGRNRIYYSLTDGKTITPGFIDIAVSDIGIEQPEADNFIAEAVVTPGEENNINIQGHFDDKGQKLQLADVSAFNADVSIINQYEFSFVSEQPGIHYVTYYVTNELGGLAVGIIQVNVGGAPYQDITIDIDGIDTTFVAPKEINSLSEDEKKSVVAKYKETGEFGPKGVIMPLFDVTGSVQVCNKMRSFVPSIDELKKLYNNAEENLFEQYYWPITKKYITSEGFLFDFKTGEVTYSDGIGYLTCLK